MCSRSVLDPPLARPDGRRGDTGLCNSLPEHHLSHESKDIIKPYRSLKSAFATALPCRLPPLPSRLGEPV